MSHPPGKRLQRRLLPVIMLVYLALGSLYALYTPAWQAPDEPAHYNYIRYLAEQHRFPILKPGDYPAVYLEEIKAARFPPEMSIAPIRYEFHQPPFYYLLSVPLHSLLDGALLPQRLFSVMLGALLLLVAHEAVRELAPNRPCLALGSAAFVAFLPMHLAMSAAVNNDTLAELLLATILLLTIRYLKGTAVPLQERGEERLLVLLGLTTGLSFFTKSNVYVALPLVLAAILVRWFWLQDGGRGVSVRAVHPLKALLLYLVPAIGLGLPWWLRNLAVYGGADWMGLGRHNQVVAGQLRTAQFVAEHGAGQLVRDFVLTSFCSFWGQFGWMGVLLDQRLYQAAAILSALALFGFLMWASGAWRARASFARWQWAAGGLLAFLVALNLASYLWYNSQFLQHQGRYLFPALVPIGLAAALGWSEALRRERAVLLALLLLLAGVGLRLAGIVGNWPMFLLVVTAAGLAVRSILPQRWDPAVQAAPYLALIVLDLTSLFFFIVPQLRV